MRNAVRLLCATALLLCLPWSLSASAATPTITLSVGTGTVGTSINVTGSGFPPGEIVALYVDSPIRSVSSTPPGKTADSSGSFTDTFIWPDSGYDPNHRIDPTKPGVHQVCGDTEGNPNGPQPIAAKACAAFTVVAPSPSPSQASGGSPASLPEILIALAVLAVIVVGMALWFRSSR